MLRIANVEDKLLKKFLTLLTGNVQQRQDHLRAKLYK